MHPAKRKVKAHRIQCARREAMVDDQDQQDEAEAEEQEAKGTGNGCIPQAA